MSKANETEGKTLDWLHDVEEYPYQANFDLDKLYLVLNDELGLQQKKRDQIITLYLAMITFFVPFTIELSGVLPIVKGFMFLFLSVIGFVLALIIIRYRVYKEVFWIALRTMSQLKNYPKDVIDKQLVQSLYYKSLCKTAGKFVNPKKKRIRLFKLAKKSFFSAETLYYVLQAFVSSAILAVAGIFLLDFMPPLSKYLVTVAVGLAAFLLQYFRYVRALAKIYAAAAEPSDEDSFNYGFSKAWHLHFYQK